MPRGKSLKHDLLGRSFGKLKVIGRDRSITSTAAWQVQCECGTVKSVLSHNLRSGLTISCGCHKKSSSYVGKRRGSLLATRFFVEGNDRKIELRCDCGSVSLVSYNAFVRSKATCCGCQSHTKKYKHGHSRSLEYRYWNNFKGQAIRDDSFPEEWNEFEVYLKDVGPRPSNKHQLVRKSLFQKFSKTNFQWTTKTRPKGRPGTFMVTVNGKKLWARYMTPAKGQEHLSRLISPWLKHPDIKL